MKHFRLFYRVVKHFRLFYRVMNFFCHGQAGSWNHFGQSNQGPITHIKDYLNFQWWCWIEPRPYYIYPWLFEFPMVMLNQTLALYPWLFQFPMVDILPGHEIFFGYFTAPQIFWAFLKMKKLGMLTNPLRPGGGGGALKNDRSLSTSTISTARLRFGLTYFIKSAFWWIFVESIPVDM